LRLSLKVVEAELTNTTFKRGFFGNSFVRFYQLYGYDIENWSVLYVFILVKFLFAALFFDVLSEEVEFGFLEHAVNTKSNDIINMITFFNLINPFNVRFIQL